MHTINIYKEFITQMFLLGGGHTSLVLLYNIPIQIFANFQCKTWLCVAHVMWKEIWVDVSTINFLVANRNFMGWLRSNLCSICDEASYIHKDFCAVKLKL